MNLKEIHEIIKKQPTDMKVRRKSWPINNKILISRNFQPLNTIRHYWDSCDFNSIFNTTIEDAFSDDWEFVKTCESCGKEL